MKKNLFYISTAILLLLVGMQTASAATSPIDELIEETKNQTKTAIAQNMYLEIYKEINNKPQENAAKSTSSKYKMTEDQINKVMKDGDLSPITKDQKNATVDQVFLQYKKMANDYNSALETENLRSELEMQTKPSEIFMDGDTSNSEFDVLYDLTIIEVILFNQGSTSQFGGKFIVPDFDFSDKDDEAFINNLFNKDEETEVDSTQTGEDQFSSLSCLIGESNLNSALSAFDENQQNDGQSENGTEEEPTEAEFPKAVSDDWPTEYLCPDGGFYCIEITFDIKAAKAYGKSDNCVACHIQDINKNLDKLLGKPLSANKLTGNLFEMPKCKASFVNLPANMNIITLAVQPPRQANQNKYINLSIEKEWVKMKERFNAYFNNTDNPPPTLTVEDRSVKEAFQGASANATIDEISIKAQERVQVAQGEVSEGIDSKEKENRTELNNTEYQMVVDELETMKKSFETILQKLKEMKTPCTDLSTKSYCS
jgi:hypothetical protein